MIRVSWIVQSRTRILRILSERLGLGNPPCDLFAGCVENRTDTAARYGPPRCH
jgi:hypothetical protein